MRKLLLILFLMICASPPASAAIGNVTQGPFSYAPLNVQDTSLCSSTSPSGSYLIQQFPLNTATAVISLNGTFSGTITVYLTANSGTTWTSAGTVSSTTPLSVVVAGYTHLCADVTTYTSGIIGTTISSSLGISATGGGGGITQVASLPATCTPGVTGAVQLTVAPYAIYTCTATNTWTISGASALQGGLIQGSNYLVSDPVHGQIITDGSWLNSSSTLNSAAMAQWTSAIIGDIVFGTRSCTPGAGNPIDTIPVNVPLGTVTGVNTALQITVSTTTTSAVASGGCIFIGQAQDTQMASISSAVAANTVICPTVILPAGVFAISSVPNFLEAQPTGCANNAMVLAQLSGGQGGYLVKGQGPNSTIIVILPSLLPSGCTNGISSSACFVVVPGGSWTNFQLTGLGNSLTGHSDGTKILFERDSYTGMRDMLLSGWGAGDTGVTSWYDENGGGSNWTFESLVSQWGQEVSLDGSNIVRNFQVQHLCGNTQVLDIGGTIQSQGGFLVYLDSLCNSAAGNRTMLDLTSASSYTSGVGDFFRVSQGASSSNAMVVDATSSATLGPSTLLVNGVSSAGFALQNNGGIVHANGVTFTGGAGTGVLNYNSGSFFEDGRIVATGSTHTVNNLSSWFRSVSASGTTLATSNIGLTSGWGTSSVATATGDSHEGRFTITGAAGSAGPTLTLTFPTAYWVAPASCVLFPTGANDSTDFSNVIAGTPTTTSVLFTFTGTSTAVTLQYDYKCGP